MIKRKANVYYLHVLAMKLILQMEESLNSFPNIEFVRDHKTPPTIDEVPDADMKRHLSLLRDMLPYVEPAVYETFQKTIDSSMSADDIANVMIGSAKLDTVITESLNLGLWSGDYPHGCFWIMREVVPHLLGVRMS